MTDTVVDALVLDLLEWLGPEPRPRREVLSAWGTSCPRLPVWEEAHQRGFVVESRGGGGVGPLISVSSAGRRHLKACRRAGS